MKWMKPLKHWSRFVGGILILITATLLFYWQFSHMVSEFQNVSREKGAMIDEHIVIEENFIRIARIQAEDILGRKIYEPTPYNTFLTYNARDNSYQSDRITTAFDPAHVGNVSGTGLLEDEGLQAEIAMSMRLNRLFDHVCRELEDLAWVYYTSERDFIFMFPYISSEAFRYDTELKNMPFYKMATPENNLEHDLVWTPVYMDAAGKGLMVTLSIPIFSEGEFRGVLSLDMTNEKLSNLIDSKYESYIIDGSGTVIAVNGAKASDSDIQQLSDFIRMTPELEKVVNGTPDEEIHLTNRNLVYVQPFKDTDWRMISLLPVKNVVMTTFFSIIPVLLVGIMFFMSHMEVEKRRRTEIQLKHSLVELQAYQQLLENAAKFDFLTNTYNRRGFEESFNKLSQAYGDVEKAVALLLADIDLFKAMNDTYGHAAGDKVLTDIAMLMKQNVRDVDTVCRWGGEEFLIMLAEDSPEEAFKTANRIREAVEAHGFGWEGETLKATVTIGLAMRAPEESLEEAIRRADKALYRGKESGRNRVIADRKA